MASTDSLERQAKWLLGNDLRTELIRQYARNSVSPAILASRFGDVSLSRVAYHTSILNKHGLLSHMETRPRGGTSERFYELRMESELAGVADIRRLIAASRDD